MTCIVGHTDGTTVTIGGDSLGVDGHSMIVRKDHKVFRNGEFLIGFTTSFRMGDILRYDWTPPVQVMGDTMATREFMITRVISSIRDVLKEQGFATKHNDAEQGGTFLVGYKGCLFVIDCDYQVGEHECGFAAVGSGRDVAMGAMHALSGVAGVSVEAAVRRALRAASDLNTTVGGPFFVESV